MDFCYGFNHHNSWFDCAMSSSKRSAFLLLLLASLASAAALLLLLAGSPMSKSALAVTPVRGYVHTFFTVIVMRHC